eukprot:403343629
MDNTDNTDSRQTLAPLMLSINSNSFLQPIQNNQQTSKTKNEQFNQTQSSFKASAFNLSKQPDYQENETVIFYESEYFSSTMPSSLPSSQQANLIKPKTVFENQINRPSTPVYKPNNNSNQLNVEMSSLGKSSQYSNVSKVQESNYGKLKIQNLDLDKVIEQYPIEVDDQTLPKYLRFNIQEVYKKTGLPSAVKKALPGERELFMIMNIFRVYRRFLLQILEECLETRKNTNKNGFKQAKSEGISAVIDAIEYIKKLPPLKPFYWNKLLSKVSKLHAQECSKNNSISHKSKKGERPVQRMKRYGHVFFGGAQSIFTGINNQIDQSNNCPGVMEQVLSQIIDDGTPSRWHRKNILNQAHRTVGIALENHPSQQTVVVCKYAFHYCSNKQEEPLKQIINQWVQEEQNDSLSKMNLFQGTTFKYKITFQYPQLIKTTTIARQKEGIQAMEVLHEYTTIKDAEKILYNENNER